MQPFLLIYFTISNQIPLVLQWKNQSNNCTSVAILLKQTCMFEFIAPIVIAKYHRPKFNLSLSETLTVSLFTDSKYIFLTVSIFSLATRCSCWAWNKDINTDSSISKAASYPAHPLVSGRPAGKEYNPIRAKPSAHLPSPASTLLAVIAARINYYNLHVLFNRVCSDRVVKRPVILYTSSGVVCPCSSSSSKRCGYFSDMTFADWMTPERAQYNDVKEVNR